MFRTQLPWAKASHAIFRNTGLSGGRNVGVACTTPSMLSNANLSPRACPWTNLSFLSYHAVFILINYCFLFVHCEPLSTLVHQINLEDVCVCVCVCRLCHADAVSWCDVWVYDLMTPFTIQLRRHEVITKHRETHFDERIPCYRFM